MRTLFVGYRVSDLERSLEFYTALGYRDVGRVELGQDGQLVVLNFDGERVPTLELLHQPELGPVEVGGFDHLAVQADEIAALLGRLGRAGLEPGPIEYPDGPDGPKTAWVTDPDGYRIEVVEWPPGHPWRRD